MAVRAQAVRAAVKSSHHAATSMKATVAKTAKTPSKQQHGSKRQQASTHHAKTTHSLPAGLAAIATAPRTPPYTK
jgi:hypothetical protein